MVHSVVGISTSDKIKRDANRAANSYSHSKQQNSLFSQIFEQKIAEQQEAPAECYTVTYGQDSKIRTFQYQTREYNY